MSANRGTTCTICNHRERPAIDLALARRVSMNALSKRYELGSDALYRHSKNHLPPQLRAQLLAGPDIETDLDQLKATESQSLLANLVHIRHRLFGALDMAEEHGDGFMLTRTTSQLHTNLELTGKLLGDLGVGHTTINNVLVLPAYIELRAALTNALADFPEARRAVAAVLHAIESKAAADITATDMGRKMAHGQVPALIEGEVVS
jgi:hypothetical protein